MNTSHSKITVSDYASELFLYSGQYALYYTLMNLSYSGVGFLGDFGHLFLLLALIIQTYVAVRLDSCPLLKILATFIAPLFYTLAEFQEGYTWLLQMGHFFFWAYTALLGVLWFGLSQSRRNSSKIFFEFLITFTNISIFLFVYFYFDLRLDLDQELAAGAITAYEYREGLEFYNLAKGVSLFMHDPAHLYVILGGFFLALTIATGRIKILFLTQKINDLLARYMDTRIRDRLIFEQAGSEKRRLVILYSDIRNFSNISERYPPDSVVQTLNLYYQKWYETAQQHHGIINKFIGDAVLILFALDEPVENGAEHAVATSETMLENLEKLKLELREQGLPELEDIGIGIHAGEVILGSVGGENRKDYTVIGDHVNIAARLESHCKTSGSRLLVSKDFFELLKPGTQNRFETIGEVLLKGKQESVELFAHPSSRKTR